MDGEERVYLGEKEPEMENHHRKWKEIKDHLDNPEILHKVFRKSVMARRRFHADELRALAARTRYSDILPRNPTGRRNSDAPNNPSTDRAQTPNSALSQNSRRTTQRLQNDPTPAERPNALRTTQRPPNSMSRRRSHKV